MGCSRPWFRTSTGSSGTDLPSLELRPAAFVYVTLVSLAAPAAMLITAASTPVSAGVLAKFLALLGCGLASVEATRRMEAPQETLVHDLLTVWCLPIAVLLPPFWVLVAPVPSLAFTQWRVHRGIVHRRLFGAAAIGLAYGSAPVIFHTLPASIGGSNPGSAGHPVRWAVAVAGCDIVAWIVHNSLIAVAMRVSDPPESMTGAVFGREAMVGDFVQFCLGVVVTVVIAVNPLLLAFAAPSVLLQRRFVMHAQLLSRTRIDAKTRLLNATTWECQANVEIARAARTRTPLAIALVDIDHFKNVNDTDGHLAGDQVLQAVTATFRDHLREYDTAGRFGGDEFAILLPHAARDDAYGIAERLRAHIAGLQIPVRSRPGTPGVAVTISIGVATFDGRVPRALSDLLAAADAALYQAKRTGRNTVRVVTDIGPYPGRARDAGGVPRIVSAGVGPAGVGPAGVGPAGVGPDEFGQDGGHGRSYENPSKLAASGQSCQPTSILRPAVRNSPGAEGAPAAQEPMSARTITSICWRWHGDHLSGRMWRIRAARTEDLQPGLAPDHPR